MKENTLTEHDDLLPRLTVTGAVTERIRRKILTGAFEEGAYIRQEDLAEELGVSRLPIREAIRQLAAEGLITLLPHRHARVSTISPAELTELVELRLWVEPSLVRLAIQSATEAQIMAMERILAELQATSPDDSVALTEVNCRLHVSFCMPSNRRRSVELVETLLQNTGRYRVKMMRAGGQKQASADHQEILECFRCRDPERGAALVRKHIVDWHNFVKSLDAGLSQAAS
jgi:DNA-binding GntR family transcriptional regulator